MNLVSIFLNYEVLYSEFRNNIFLFEYEIYCPSKKRITHGHFFNNPETERAREVGFSDMERAPYGASFHKRKDFRKVFPKQGF